MPTTESGRFRPVSDPAPATVQAAVRIPAPLAKRLDSYAARRKTTRSAVIIEALDDYLTTAGRRDR